jgi:sterol desaturase/sphingolipid hydroxylase (fatty acid hydroxylase superfamily)
MFDPATRLTILAIAMGFMALEYLLSRLVAHDEETHDLAETATSFGLAIGQNVIRGLEAGIIAIPFAAAYNYRLLNFDQSAPLAIAALFLATEFVYYWHHRAAHRIRWMWATHSVHHSATKLNLTAAIRLGWTGNISGNFIFFLPLAWLGFHPLAILGMLGINLIYQFFAHTEFAPRLGPLEWILNTPAHHRVHHASNTSCLDKNYGGMLIVFDRIFGTFAEAPRDQTLRYGLVGGTQIRNPIHIAFNEWISMWRDFRAAPSLGAKFRALFAPPGSTRTAPPFQPNTHAKLTRRLQ